MIKLNILQPAALIHNAFLSYCYLNDALNLQEGGAYLPDGADQEDIEAHEQGLRDLKGLIAYWLAVLHDHGIDPETYDGHLG